MNESETDQNRSMQKKTAKSPGRQQFGWLSFLLRFVAALLLVLLTYNPSEFSLYSWMSTAFSGDSLGAIHFFICALFLIGWTIFLVATYNSLGPVGVVLGAIFFATLIWMLVDFGILAASSLSAVTWIALVCLAALLAIGLSWSHVWRRMTGQLVVDDIEN